jgi:hypothetical protein
MLSLLNGLMKVGADFYPFERLVLDEVKSRLGAESGARLQRQIEAINKIQRLSDGKEVNFYQMRHGKPAFDDNLRFPHAASEALLASVYLTSLDKRSKLKVEVWLAKGRLFSLVFNKPPKQFFAGASLKTVRPEIANVKIWLDPMRPLAVPPDQPVDVSALTGWLHEWYAKGRVTGLRAPLSESERAACFERIDARLPPDYLDLVAQTEGATLATCTVHGAREIRKLVWPDANYYLIAEIKGLGALVVKEDDRDSMLYFLHYENNDVRPVGASLQKAIADLLKLD